MSKHTPGPWKIGEVKTFELKGGRTNESRRIDSFRVSSIAEVYGDDKESIANAKLIAKAWLIPELLEALKEVIAISDRKHDAWDKAKAVIKKATQ